MSKELLENLLIEFDEMGFEPTILCDSKKEIDSFRNRLKQVLDYFKSIDNANPSKATECLEKIKNSFGCDMAYYNLNSEYETVEQALIKAQENEKDKVFLKNLHNTNVKVPLVSIFNNLSKEKRFAYTEHIYYHWEEMEEALEAEIEDIKTEKENLESKTKRQEKILKIIKEKCLHNDNLNYMAVCINYDMYKEKMSERYDTKVVKTNWNDKDLLDYLKLLTEEEFNTLKRYFEKIFKIGS